MSVKWLCAAAILIVTAAALQAVPTITEGHFQFTTFAVSNTNPAQISASGINNFGEAVGGYEYDLPSPPFAANSPCPWKGYIRFPNGTVTAFSEPDDTFPNCGFTRADGVNDEGTVTGTFFDNTASPANFAGFFDRNGQFTKYNVPNQLGVGDATDIAALNDLGDFCGYIGYPANTFADQPNSTYYGFMVVRGVLTIFSVPGADPTKGTFCVAINNWTQTAGQYLDKNGILHGFVRETNGQFQTIDVPGASKTLPASPTPCTLGGFFAGTTVNGLNDFGEISGHFYTPSNNQHGYVRTPNGRFLQIDVPGASETGGGGVNDLGHVTGHYIAGSDATCTERGYIANPRDGDND